MKLKKLFVCWDGFPNFGDNLCLSCSKQTHRQMSKKVIDESYVQPDYVMGYSLSEGRA